jgi:hypothetical protein
MSDPRPSEGCLKEVCKVIFVRRAEECQSVLMEHFVNRRVQFLLRVSFLLSYFQHAVVGKVLIWSIPKDYLVFS